MRFASLRGVRVREVSDDHYRMVSVQYGGATLVFGTGPNWNYGLPSLATLKAMVEVQERDVETPWGFPAAEYRGRRHDGTQWREILIFGESIEYDEARATVAAHFDAVMDSLCFEAATAG